jgi:hypothetical protein
MEDFNVKRKSKRVRPKTRGGWTLWILTGVIAVLATLAFIVFSKAPEAPWVRTVTLVHGGVSSQAGDTVHFVDGTAPTQTTTAVVLTDSNCTPDGQGISHCFNTVRLPNGQVITVRHDHNMRVVPCLAPGESIRLVPQA